MSSKDSDYSRRKFLTDTAIGLAAVSAANLSPGFAKTNKTSGETKAIIYRQLGKNGPKLPIVSMGEAALSEPSIIQAAFERGIRHFDTAAEYMSGLSERRLGNVINNMGVREKVIIATKFYAVQKCRGLSAEETKKRMLIMMDASLRRLKTDYVDVFYLYCIENAGMVNHPAILEGLAELKERKKARQVGVSTHINMAEVINATAKHDIFDVILTTINFTYANDKSLLKAIKNAADKGIGIVAMKTQAGGSRWQNPESRKDYSTSIINRAALKWVLRNESITTSIPTITNYDHLNEDFAIAYDLEYTEEEEKFLKDNKAVLSIGFCKQCRKCLASCPNDADIPTLMRTHMYAAQYGALEYARSTYDSIPKVSALNACASCTECIAKCANTVDIDRRISELKMIYG